MLQVFDRVMSSRSELTLLVMSLITLFCLAMAFAEWMRSRVLVRSAMAGCAVGHPLFNASFDAPIWHRRGSALLVLWRFDPDPPAS